MRLRTSQLVATAALVFAASVASRGQEAPPAGPGPELKRLEFLLGKRTAKGKMFQGGQPAADWTSTETAEWGPGGHSLKAEAVMDYGPNLKDSSLTMMSYDALAKVYRLYRFSSIQQEPIEASGKFEGDKLVMMIKPGGPNIPLYRITFAPKGKAEYLFLLEEKKGENFEKFLEGTYAKS